MAAAPVFLSEREVAERWRLSTRYVRQLRRNGLIDHVRFGRRVAYPIEAIVLYEQENTVLARVATMPRRRNA